MNVSHCRETYLVVKNQGFCAIAAVLAIMCQGEAYLILNIQSCRLIYWTIIVQTCSIIATLPWHCHAEYRIYAYRRPNFLTPQICLGQFSRHDPLHNISTVNEVSHSNCHLYLCFYWQCDFFLFFRAICLIFVNSAEARINLAPTSNFWSLAHCLEQ